MTDSNFAASLAFVWLPQFDSPSQGFHTTPGDAGGGTFGGVTEATWASAVKSGIIQPGTLVKATTKKLSAVLKVCFWGQACDALPGGLDLALFNGRMMTGDFPKLLQQCLGFVGADDVDGWIGPASIAAAAAGDAATLIKALHGAHYAYLTRLAGWPEFKGGWTTRLQAAREAALALAVAPGAIA